MPDNVRDPTPGQPAEPAPTDDPTLPIEIVVRLRERELVVKFVRKPS